jgi:ribosomal protein S18 acetylase RimI-like enzyme
MTVKNVFSLRESDPSTDLPFFFKIRNDRYLQKLLLSTREGSSADDALVWLSSKIVDSNTIFRVIEDSFSGRAVGYLQLSKDIHSSNFHLGICCDSDYQGKGAGRSALREGCILLKAVKANKVLLEVDKTNTKAISLYLSEGFRLIGEMSRHLQIRGDVIDVLLMEKLI